MIQSIIPISLKKDGENIMLKNNSMTEKTLSKILDLAVELQDLATGALAAPTDEKREKWSAKVPRKIAEINSLTPAR